MRKILLISFLSCSLLAKEVCVFTPPEEWLLVDPAHLSPRVKIGFMTKSKGGFCPSLNLATEEVNLSLEEYIQAVKKLYAQDPNIRLKDLGSIDTHSGNFRLIEIESTIPLGKARIMQAIAVQDHTAYILTAAALKEEFSKYYTLFDAAFSSLSITDDLTSALTDPTKQKELKTLYQELLKNAKKEDFENQYFSHFQDKIVKEYTGPGPYWQILFLKQAREELAEIQNKSETTGEDIYEKISNHPSIKRIPYFGAASRYFYTGGEPTYRKYGFLQEDENMEKGSYRSRSDCRCSSSYLGSFYQ